MSRSKGSDVSPLDAHLGFWMRRVSNHVSGSFEELLKGAGCSVTEWVALRQLYEDGPSSHAALMGALGMTKGAVSKVVSRLEARGLVARRTREDFLGQSLELTDAGRELVPELARLADANDEAFFGQLADRQRRDLLELLKALAATHQMRTVPVD